MVRLRYLLLCKQHFFTYAAMASFCQPFRRTGCRDGFIHNNCMPCLRQCHFCPADFLATCLALHYFIAGSFAFTCRFCLNFCLCFSRYMRRAVCIFCICLCARRIRRTFYDIVQVSIHISESIYICTFRGIRWQCENRCLFPCCNCIPLNRCRSRIKDCSILCSHPAILRYIVSTGCSIPQSFFRSI